MTRAALFLVLLGAVALPGCTREDPNRIVLSIPPAPSAAPEPPPAPPPARTTRNARGRTVAAPAAPVEAPPPAVPTAPRPGETYVSPAPTAAQRDQAAIIAACRQQAERTILERDRGQIMREEEQMARLGASSSAFDSQFTSDRLGRVFARDRMVEDCIDRNRPAAPRTPQGTPPAAPR